MQMGRSPERVGVIGVGNMGSAMAQRLLDQQVPVTVRDVRPEAEAPLLERGASRAASPAGCRCVPTVFAGGDTTLCAPLAAVPNSQ